MISLLLRQHLIILQRLKPVDNPVASCSKLGHRGPSGPTGTSVTGRKGDRGPAGLPGSQGARGQNGTIGSSGKLSAPYKLGVKLQSIIISFILSLWINVSLVPVHVDINHGMI